MKRFRFLFLMGMLFSISSEAQTDHCNKRQVTTPSVANGWRGANECTWAYGDHKAQGFLDKLEADAKSVCYRISDFEEGKSFVFRGDFPWKLWSVIYNFKCKDPSQIEKPESNFLTENQFTTENQFKRSIENSKIKCSELGFKPATDSFGKCVLQLTK